MAKTVWNTHFFPTHFKGESHHGKTMTTGSVPTVREILIKYQQGIPVATSLVEYGTDDDPNEVRPIMDKLDTMERVRQYHIQQREAKRRAAVNTQTQATPAPPTPEGGGKPAEPGEANKE